MTTLPSASVLVRTWFGDDGAWDSFVLAAQEPNEYGFGAGVTLVNDPVFEGLSPEGLVAKQPGGAFVSFLADETTLTDADHPILAVWVFPRRDDDDDDRPDPLPFRVAAAALWSVENNINLANMDWADFTRSIGPDGIFRGF